MKINFQCSRYCIDAGLGICLAIVSAGSAYAEPDLTTGPVRAFATPVSVAKPSTTLARSTTDPRSAPLTAAEKSMSLNEEGVELIFHGDHISGLKKLEAANELDSSNTTVLYNLAGLYIANGETKKAVQAMENAVKIQPKDLSFLNRLAESHFADSNIDSAVNTFERIVEIDPGYQQALLRLGTLYGMQKRWDLAEAKLKEAAELEGSDARVLSNLGSVLVVQKKFKEAVPVLVKAQAVKETPANCVALGIAHEALGETDEAIKFFSHAKELGETNQTQLDKHIAELRTKVSH